MPQQEKRDSWKERLAQCFAQATGYWSFLGITTSYTKGDLIVYCRNYVTRQSKLIARVSSHTAVFFLQGVLAEMNALRRGAAEVTPRPVGRTGWRLPIAQGGRR